MMDPFDQSSSLTDSTDYLNLEPGPEFEDITESFLGACKSIPLGKLVTCPNFTLFEAMSSIELMDAKMDSGMVSKQVDREILSFSEAIEAGVINISNVRTEVMVEIFDTIFRSIVTFLEGQTLVQTVFTCLYLHNPQQIEQSVLRTMCFGLLRVVDRLYGVINDAMVFEEEDIHLVTFGHTFQNQVTDKLLLHNLKTEIESCSKSKTPADEQLCLRLSFLHLLFPALNNCRNGNEQEIRRMPQVIDKLREKLSKFKQVDASSWVEQSFQHDGYSTVLGFDPLVNQHLLPPTFPKVAPMCDWTKSCHYFDWLLMAVKKSCTVFCNSPCLASVLNLVSTLSRDPQSNLAGRSVAQVILLPMVDGGAVGQAPQKTICGQKVGLFAVKAISMSLSHLPFTSDDEKLVFYTEEFKDVVERSIYLIIKAYGRNRARLREGLISVNYELSQMQDFCLTFDNAVMAHYSKRPRIHRLYSWLMLQMSSVIREFLLLGLELELYGTHELLYIFWYLADFLLLWSSSLQNDFLEKLSAKELLLQPELYVTTPSTNSPYFVTERKTSHSGSASSSSKKSKSQQKQQKQLEQTLLTDSLTLFEHQATNLKYLKSLLSLFCGYYKVLILMKSMGQLKGVQDSRFDNEKLRFERRFLPVSHHSDCFPSYERFKEAERSHCEATLAQPLSVLHQASESFRDAKALFTEVKGMPSAPSEVELYLKLSCNNLIVLNLTSTTIAKLPKDSDYSSAFARLALEFNPQYSNWPVLKFCAS